MEQYLLKRRVRHIRSIKLSNIKLVEKDSSGIQFQFLSCFISLETHKGKIIYVSEVQQASFQTIQFNELPYQDSSLTNFLLKVIISAPESHIVSSLKPSEISNDEKWVVFKTYTVDMNKLIRIRENCSVDSPNVPIFEVLDGFYVLHNLPIVPRISDASVHRRAISNYKIKQSFSFNSVLKLTMLIEYMRQVKEETGQTSHSIDASMKVAHKQTDWMVKSLMKSIQHLEKDIQNKKEQKTELLASYGLSRKTRQVSSISQDHSLNDYYGNTYSDLIRVKSRIEVFRLKKFKQLVSILRSTRFFDNENGFIELKDSPSTLYERIDLKLLNIKAIFTRAFKSDTERIQLNSALGYYLLFLLIIARDLFDVSLPYSLHFYGSTSVVEGHFPLYLDDSQANKYNESFINAVVCFNRNIIQIKQHLDLRRTILTENQIFHPVNHSDASMCV